MKTLGIGGDGQREGGSWPASLGTHPYLLLGFGKPQGFELLAQLLGEKRPSAPICKPHKCGQFHFFGFPLLQGEELEELGGKLKMGFYRGQCAFLYYERV